MSAQKIAPSGIEACVCDDIAHRQQIGIKKYGQTVAENPLSLRDWLQHAYEESLDHAVYLKRAISEIDNGSGELDELKATAKELGTAAALAITQRNQARADLAKLNGSAA